MQANPAPVHIDLNQRDSKICSRPTTPSLPESPHIRLLPFSALFHSNVCLYLTCAGTGHLKGLIHTATILNRCSLLHTFYKQTAVWLEQARLVGIFKWCNRLLLCFHSSPQNLKTAQLEPRKMYNVFFVEVQYTHRPPNSSPELNILTLFLQSCQKSPGGLPLSTVTASCGVQIVWNVDRNKIIIDSCIRYLQPAFFHFVLDVLRKSCMESFIYIR